MIFHYLLQDIKVTHFSTEQICQPIHLEEINFESLEDSAIDLINYASFFVSYLRGGIEGQTANHDFLNRIKPTKHDRPEPKDEGSVGSVVTVGLVPRATGSTPSEESLMRNKREPKI